MSIAESPPTRETAPLQRGRIESSKEIHPLSHAQDTAAGADDAALLVPIQKILVADRYRKDLGDVSELAASIVEIGLLNPITVTAYHGGYRLVAGERRLTAFKAMGLTEIPARVARNIIEARDLLVAERDENTQRKPMLPSEAAALGMAIEEMEKPAARDRMLAGRAPSGPGTGGSGSHESRGIAAEAIGMSEPTYRRVKQALITAEDETEPDEVRDVARDALARIDAGAPIRNQVERIKETRRKTESVTTETIPNRGTREQMEEKWAQIAEFAEQGLASEQIARKFGMTPGGVKDGAKKRGIDIRADRILRGQRRIKPLEVLEKTILGLEVSESVLPLVSYEEVTAEMASEWLQRLESPLRAIRKMQNTLKEIR